MKPRILGVVRWPVGGIRTWCRYVYRNRLFEDFEIDLLMPRVPESEILDRDLRGTGVNCMLTEWKGGVYRFAIEIMKALTRTEYSLVHAHGFTSALAAYAPCLAKRIPYLVTTHDVILDDQYRDLRGRVARRALSWVLRGADCVQAVSFASARNLRSAFPGTLDSDDLLVTVPNGIESERFLNASRVDLKARLNIPPNSLVVGFFGRFMAQKGFKYLVEAVALDTQQREASLPPIYVVAVGSDGFRREEEDDVRKMGISDRFRFLDFDPNISDTMRSVDVVAMPSLWEACGLLAMESLVAGTPLVVGDCEALSDICDATPSTIVRRRDASDLLSGIRIQGMSSAKTEADAYRAIAAEKFDVKRTCEGIFDLYKNILMRNEARIRI